MPIDVKGLMREIKESHRKLNSCSKHDFSIDATPDKKFDKMYSCTSSEGEVGAADKSWYEKWLEEAKNYV